MAMSFKELLRADLNNVFLNPEEFAAEHTVNGKKMLVTVDNNELIERQKSANSHMDGIYTKSTLIFVKAADFGPLPAVGGTVNLDGKIYKVTNATNEDGLFSIHLEANRS